jgi:hypothetical protein
MWKMKMKELFFFVCKFCLHLFRIYSYSWVVIVAIIESNIGLWTLKWPLSGTPCVKRAFPHTELDGGASIGGC